MLNTSESREIFYMIRFRDTRFYTRFLFHLPGANFMIHVALSQGHFVKSR